MVYIPSTGKSENWASRLASRLEVSLSGEASAAGKSLGKKGSAVGAALKGAAISDLENAPSTIGQSIVNNLAKGGESNNPFTNSLIQKLDAVEQHTSYGKMFKLEGAVENVLLSNNFINRPDLHIDPRVPEMRPSANPTEPGLSPQTTGNEIKDFVDGPAYLQELLTRIANAKTSIWLESYEWQDVANLALGDDTGKQVAQALIDAKKKNPNLDIRVIVDNRCSYSQVANQKAQASADSPIVTMLRAGGIDVRQVKYDALRLNHRKLSVFDGNDMGQGGYAFVGGQNLGNNYLLPLSAGWTYHDQTQRFQGPAVYDVAAVFQNSWVRTGGTPLRLPRRHAPIAGLPTSAAKVQIVMHSAGIDRNIERELIQRIDAEGAITAVGSQITLENGFGMSDAIFYALLRARKRGVPVVWLWGPASDDSTIMASVHFWDLKNAGVVIRKMPTPVHMKAYHFKQGDTLLQGSSNMDGSSTILNDECDAQVEGGGVAQSFYDNVLASDIAKSTIMNAPMAPAPLPANATDADKKAAKLHRNLVLKAERVIDGDHDSRFKF